MRLRILALAALVAAAPALLAQTPAGKPAPSTITLPLWPHGAPGAPAHPAPETNLTTRKSARVAGRPIIRLTNVSDPTLTLYRPRGHNSGAAVLVFPGGGYRVLVIDITGTEICHWLNSIGVNCILVKYRVPGTGPYPKSAVALQDAQRATSLARQHAAAWHIDPHRIGVMGFSAGGDLAAVLSTHFQKRVYKPVDAADKLSCRPDFTMLIYPAYLADPRDNLKLNPAIDVTANTPQAFLVQAEDDPVHVENVIDYFLALKRAGVPAEMHIYAYGGHGYGLRPVTQSTYVHDVPASNKTPLPISHWPSLAATWLHSISILK